MFSRQVINESNGSQSSASSLRDESSVEHKKSSTPREIPVWERIGDFSYKDYYDGIPLDRRMSFVNNSPTAMVKELVFLGYVKNQIKLEIAFKDSAICHDFLDALPEDILADIGAVEKKISITVSSQEKFDTILKTFHQQYPLSQEMLSTLPGYLNTHIPTRLTDTDWLQSYPEFNPEFIASTGRFNDENSLSYALNIKTAGPSLLDLDDYKHSSDKQLDYVARELNTYYKDQTLAIRATHQRGKLPPLKQGYYIISLHYSPEKGVIQTKTDKYDQTNDFHILVQNNDGFFSHRRKQESAPERVDSNGNNITLPESTPLFYVTNEFQYGSNFPTCMDYRFVGYLYLKTTETRRNLPTASFTMLNEMEQKAKTQPAIQDQLMKFKGRFFMYPPLPEFFADARSQIKEMHASLS